MANLVVLRDSNSGKRAPLRLARQSNAIQPAAGGLEKDIAFLIVNEFNLWLAVMVGRSAWDADLVYVGTFLAEIPLGWALFTAGVVALVSAVLFNGFQAWQQSPERYSRWASANFMRAIYIQCFFWIAICLKEPAHGFVFVNALAIIWLWASYLAWRLRRHGCGFQSPYRPLGD